MEHQILFEQFISLIGNDNLDRLAVQTWFEAKILKKSLYSWSSIVSAGESAIRAFNFSRKPYLWSKEKFERLIAQTPENTATLAMASGSVILVPVLTWYWISATFSGVVLYLLTKFLGYAKADPRELEVFKHWRETSRMYWDLLHNIEVVKTGLWYWPWEFILFNQPLLKGLKKLNGFIFFKNTNIHKTVQTYSNWQANVSSAKPIQILATRFEKVKPWELEGDALPAIKTAERCLSSLDPTLAKYFRLTRKQIKDDYLLKKVKEPKVTERGRLRK